MAVLVDSNVIIDILTCDENWFSWSKGKLIQLAAEGELIINQIILAEVAVGLKSERELNLAVPESIFRRESLPWEAAFVAAKRFLEYRRRGRLKSVPLPDFYIGAHAIVKGYKLLTRDPKVYRNYFPELEIITPAKP